MQLYWVYFCGAMPDDAVEIHIVVSNAVFAHVPVSRDTHPPISLWCVYSVIESKNFLPLSAGKPASPARGGQQRLHAGNIPASSATRTRWTIKWLTAQHGGIRFLCQKLAKSQIRRIMRTGNTPARFSFAGDTYTSNNQTTDGTTRW